MTNDQNPSTTQNPLPVQTENQGFQPSIVAIGTGLPSVPPETAEPQQAATAPGSGGVIDSNKIPFKDQVNGYAKKFAGATFGNAREKEWGEKKLAGEI
ncbi:uncharacterized protein L203_102968 [Cryptococcus depauperatus CBS 7841]|uniref:Uncharacterized protein n=1 Tax=Cryptococcus depauperatus CBS 7841 TaxID=1295531 RepID=A0AAJ8JST7_9TREE